MGLGLRAGVDVYSWGRGWVRGWVRGQDRGSCQGERAGNPKKARWGGEWAAPPTFSGAVGAARNLRAVNIGREEVVVGVRVRTLELELGLGLRLRACIGVWIDVTLLLRQT